MSFITGRYSQEEDDYIRAAYYVHGYKHIAQFFGRKEGSVRARAQKLGVIRNRDGSLKT